MELVRANKVFEIFQTPYADSKQLPVATGPVPILIIITAYLLVILKPGRKFMEHREPYKLNGVLRCYNMFQICYNLSMLLPGLYYLIVLRPYKLSCMSVLPQDHPLKDWERNISYAYYINKIVDLLDTVFFVLRKKYRQITFLHVFHHVIMPTGGYFVIRFQGYGGHLFFLCTFNVIVHVAMYCYYYSAIAGNPVRWKKYLTLLQMMQFIIVFSHCAYTAIQPDCQASQRMTFLYSSMSAVMFIMFANFYVQCYMRKSKKKEN